MFGRDASGYRKILYFFVWPLRYEGLHPVINVVNRLGVTFLDKTS